MNRMNMTWAAVLAAVVLWVGSPAQAGLGPQNVLVVVNEDSPSSLTIANEYIHLRNIPACNVVSLKLGDIGFETVMADVARKRVLGPVVEAIKQRGLADHVDCVAWSSDIPFAFSIGADLNAWPAKAPLDPITRKPQPLPKIFTGTASITGATCMYLWFMEKDINYIGTMSNGYCNLPRGPLAYDTKTNIDPPDQGPCAPPRGFDGRYLWAPSGERTSANGQRYLLSTVLGYTSGRGNSVNEVRECLRRAAAADGTSPKGTVYYMNNPDIRSKTRKWGFSRAVEALKTLGVPGVVLEGVLPPKKDDVIGLMTGIADFNWNASGSKILPGAICEHFTSFGGDLSYSAGQTPLSEFIRAGAAGTSGTVTEPYAVQPKFPTPAIQYYYASGCSLAEAYYQSLAGPYQTIILGDPLCRPWGRAVAVNAGATSQPAAAPVAAKGTFAFTPRCTPPKGRGVARFDVLLDGKFIGAAQGGNEFDLDTTLLPDGYHELRVVAVLDNKIETQGQAILPLQVANKGVRLEVGGIAPGRKVPATVPLKLTAACEGAGRIEFEHAGRVIATISGAKGEATIDPALLGLGPARIDAHAVFGEGEAAYTVAAAPVTAVVEPMPMLPVAKPAGNATRGLKLTSEGKAWLLAGLSDRAKLAADVLTDLGIAPRKPYTIEGWFDVAGDDLYQVQVRGGGKLALEIDGKPLPGDGDRWRLSLLHLVKGTHSLKVVSDGVEPLASLQVRVGALGCRPISEHMFYFVGEAAGMTKTVAPK